MASDENRKAPPYMPKSWGSSSTDDKRWRLSETALEEAAGQAELNMLESGTDDSQSTGMPVTPDLEKEATGYSCHKLRTGTEISCRSCHQGDFVTASRNAIELTSELEQPSPPSEMVSPTVTMRVAGIRFAQAGKIYHFESGDMELGLGDWVIVKTEKGVGLGQVAVAPCEKELEESHREGLRKIIRKAGKVDFDQKIRCQKREAEAFAYCMERIEALGLPMKLVAVECFFDGSKYVFYFTAEGRVDFRELVKQLVARFPVRIEMRQIGVRHEAKMTGGIATCGQELCCSRFLTEFKPVSVKMAKNQNLSLNPTKISGVCGRLMCCLAYEHGIYEDFRKGLPKVGKEIRSTKGDGVAVKYNPLKETVCIRLGEDSLVEVSREEILKDSSFLIEEEDTEQRDDSDDHLATLAEDEEAVDVEPS
jgi:cell fate regulator YaaT (PSP1 superfamily)